MNITAKKLMLFVYVTWEEIRHRSCQKDLFSLMSFSSSVSYWFVHPHLLFFLSYSCILLSFLHLLISNLCIHALFIHLFSASLPDNFVYLHLLTPFPFYLSVPLSPFSCNNHTHFHILPSAVSPWRPWAAGCWLGSVLMIWGSRTPALGINGLCRATTGPSTRTRPHTQMPVQVIDGQWESQPLQT